MAIRPKIGDKIKLKSWRIFNGEPPPCPWTGVIVEVETIRRRRLYTVQRDADNRLVNETSAFLARIEK